MTIAAARKPVVRAQPAIVVGHPYSGSFGMQSSQVPAIPRTATSHARMLARAAKAMIVVRTARLIRLANSPSRMSAMGGKLPLQTCNRASILDRSQYPGGCSSQTRHAPDRSPAKSPVLRVLPYGPSIADKQHRSENEQDYGGPHDTSLAVVRVCTNERELMAGMGGKLALRRSHLA